ncbi:threonine ammonia-lyase, biosynthetic [Paraferrimonas sp. SM1919]|uniref:threonine ammonia-lyase, biosynthetic n=1 Tax=Paraferrimonas sp. SM1919 TaxID=2662263 RepID=UPI0013D257FE|nr:threonine ammonia-lyase, biosynthetic [Paraferrimonas sp. SM1919]
MTSQALPTSSLAQQYMQQTLLCNVYEVAVKTPLSNMEKLSKRLGVEVLLKREDRQPVHSFKLRGAYHRMAQLTDTEKQKGVVTASAGNHAQGVALSSHAMGVDAVIVMPVTTPDIKVDAVKARGGNVCLFGENFNVANDYAKQMAIEEGRVFIPPFDDSDVIAGQGTVAMEMLQQDRNIQAVFIPVGGGGLAAGMAAYYKAVLPQVKIIAVEPDDAACLKAAMEAGEPVNLDSVGIFAEGVAVKRIGDETFRVCQQYVDEVITVTSDEICAAVKDVFEDTRAIAEPAGALSLAGLKKYMVNSNEGFSKVAAVLSGANVNFHSLRYVSERCELGEAKEAVLAVTVAEKPGSFLAFCKEIGQRQITEFNYRFSGRDSAVVFAGLQLRNGKQELDELVAQLQQAGHQVEDLSQDETAKLHVRYMVGGKPPVPLQESLFRFRFPEHPGALMNFLQGLQSRWNISLFHYRNHGAALGEALVGFELPTEDKQEFEGFLDASQLEWQEVTDSPAYKMFLTR